MVAASLFYFVIFLIIFYLTEYVVTVFFLELQKVGFVFIQIFCEHLEPNITQATKSISMLILGQKIELRNVQYC